MIKVLPQQKRQLEEAALRCGNFPGIPHKPLHGEWSVCEASGGGSVPVASLGSSVRPSGSFWHEADRQALSDSLL